MFPSGLKGRDVALKLTSVTAAQPKAKTGMMATFWLVSRIPRIKIMTALRKVNFSRKAGKNAKITSED